MPYNNYKQVKIKNIFKSVYVLTLTLILVRLLIFDNHGSKISSISVLLIMLVPIVIVLFVQKLIDKKRYSKKTNLIITIASAIVSVHVIMMLVGATVLRSITDIEGSEVLKEKANLTFLDFGRKVNDDSSQFISFDTSILAKRINYSNSNEENSLTYTTFQSHYSWAISFVEDRFISRLNRYGIDLKQVNTKLPNGIKVYSDSKKNNFVLVSEDTVVDIRKDFNNIDDNEFLDIVYNKLFIN